MMEYISSPSNVSKRGGVTAVLAVVFLSLLTACGKSPVDSYLSTPRLSSKQTTLSASKTALMVGETLVVTLSLKDQNGNLFAPTDGPVIQFLASGGTAAGNFTHQIDNGDGTYTAIFTATAAGTPLTLRAQLNNAAFDSTASVAISPIPPSLTASTVGVSASTVASGSAVTVTLNAVNSSGGVYDSAGLSVAFSCTGGTSTCSFSPVVDNRDGTYTSILTGLVAGTATTIHTTVGGAAVTSAAPDVTVTAGPAASISVVSGANQTASAGSALASAMIAVVRDANGNSVTGVTVDWTTTAGTLGSASSSTLAGGNASNTLTTATTAGPATVTAKINGTSISTTFSEAGMPGPATQIVYTTQPTGNVMEGVVLPTQPVLKITDAYGNIVVTGPDSTATVTLSLSAGTGTLGGTLSVSAVAGIATFSGISVSAKGTGKVITATKVNTVSTGGTVARTKTSNSFTINPPAPGAFTITSAVAGDSSVVLTWGTAADAISYKVIYGTTSGGPYPNVASAAAVSPLSLPGLTPGTTYYFQVTATNGTGSTNATTEASARPLSAFTIAAAKPTTGTIELSWNPSIGATSYTVQYGTASGSFSTTVSAAATSPLTIPFLTAGQSYYFMVTAVNFSGSVKASAEKIGVPASLTYDFTSAALDPSISFSRSTRALRYNSTGVLESVSANVPRFDYDPVNLTLRGLLIEEARENLLRASEDFSRSLWTRTAASVEPDNAVAPDGTTTADNLKDDFSASANHEVQSASVSKSSTNQPFTFSVFVKANQYHAVNLYLRTNAIAEAAVTTCDVSGYGAVSNTAATGSGWSNATAGIQSLSNGWFRCSLTATTDTDTNIAVRIRSVDNSGDATHDGDGASGIYLWGAQLEQGANASSYIPSLGLSLQSAQLDQAPWTVSRIKTFTAGSVANSTSVLDPEGNNNAEYIVEDNSNSAHYIRNTLTGVAPTQSFTLSFYAHKGTRDLISAEINNSSSTSNRIVGNYDLTDGTYTLSAGGDASGITGSIVSVGGDWYRCTLSGQPDDSGTTTSIRLYLRNASGAQSYSGNNSSGAYFWGVQLDAGTSALPYREIRMGSYRGADLAVVSVLSAWFNTLQGSLQSLTRLTQTPATGLSLVTGAFSDGSAANVLKQTLSSTGAQTKAIVSSSAQTDSAVSFTPTPGLVQVTSAYKSNDLQTCQAGNAGSASAAAAIPSVNRLYLGSDGEANFLNGWLVQLQYFPVRIPNGTLCEYSL